MDDFETSFWNEKVKYKDSYIIIDGFCYMIGSNEGIKGYNGKNFIIQKNNGQVIKTDNLFCQGKVPESFREALPDNSKFLKK
jgi:hypothetical protein